MNREGEERAEPGRPTADGLLDDGIEAHSAHPPRAVGTDELRRPEPKIEPRNQEWKSLYRSAPSLIHIDTGIPSDGHPFRFANAITLADFLGLLHDSWLLIMGIAVAFFLGALIRVWTMQPIYQADALLEIDKTAKGIGPLVNSAAFFEEEPLLDRHLEIMKSRFVIGKVIENLKLDIVARPRYFPLIGAAIARSNTRDQTDTDNAGKLPEPWLGLNQYAWGGEQIRIGTFDMPASYLDRPFTLIAGEGESYRLVDGKDRVVLDGAVGRLSESRLPNGGRLRLFVSQLRGRPGTMFTVVRKSPLKAIKEFNPSLDVKGIAEGLIQIKFKGPDPKRVASIANDIANVYIRHDLERTRAEPERALTFIKQQLSSVKKKVTNAENALNNYRLKQGTADLSRETQILLDKIVTTETKIADLNRQREELLERYTPRHPGRAELNELDAQLETLNQELQIVRGNVQNLPFTQQEILGLSRDVEVHSGLYVLLLNKALELEVVLAGPVSNMNAIDYADIPIEPEGLPVVLNLGLGGLIGLLLGVGVAAVRWKLNEAIEDPDVIEKRLGLPVYAAVPQSPQQERVTQNAQREEGAPAILAAAHPDDIATESLRSLRTSLNFAMFESDHKTIMITSSAPGAGKSFITVNFATVLASAGERSLIIDADLRRGVLHKYFGIRRDVGLSDIIVGTPSLIELAIRKTKIERLDVITAGTIPPNSAELLMQKRLAVILREASAHYDYIIVDTPPILAVTDAAIIGRIIDVTLLVVKAGMHPLREIEDAAKRLRQAGVNLSGVVFNGFEGSRNKYGRYTAYTYAYSKTK